MDTAGIPYNCSAGGGAPIEMLEGGMNGIFSSYSCPLESGDPTPPPAVTNFRQPVDQQDRVAMKPGRRHHRGGSSSKPRIAELS